MRFVRGAILVIITAGLIAGYASMGPLVTLGALGLMALFVVLMLRWANADDPKTRVNGEILMILQSYTNRSVEILWKIKCGFADQSDYECVKAEEVAFREQIEIDPLDSRCLYRWKQ